MGNLTDKQISTAANEDFSLHRPLIDPNIRRRLPAIPIQDTYIAQSQPETITGPASNLPLVGVSLMTVVFLLGYFLRRRFQQLKPRDSFGFLPNSQRNSLSGPELTV